MEIFGAREGRFQPAPGERIIGEGWMAFRHQIFGKGSRWRNESTRVHVTDRRVVCGHWANLIFMDEPLSNIRGFQMSYLKVVHIPCLRIFCKDGSSYLFADFRVRKLRRWLLEAGVQEYQAIGRERPPVWYAVCRNVGYVLFALWVLLGSLPTGWLYELQAGTGTEPGQRPAQSVHRIAGQGELEDLYGQETPATARGGHFLRCPLMYFRFAKGPGTSSGAYSVQRYPIPLWLAAAASFGMEAQYNYYHLLELEDGSWLCVYFDDCRMLGNVLGREIQLPAGQVRKATKTEREVLAKMAEAYPYYDVETAYILDTFGYDRPFALDVYLRIALVAGGIWLYRRAERKFILPKLNK